MPGGAAHGAQIALLEAAAAGTGQVNVVVFWEIQRRRRQRRLWIQALEIGSQAIGEGHVAPVFHGLGALDAQAGLQDQHGVPRALSWSAIIAPTTPEPTTTMSARASPSAENSACLIGLRQVKRSGRLRRHGRRSRRRRRPPERAIAAIGGHGERVAHGLVHQRLFIGDDDGGRPASHGAVYQAATMSLARSCSPACLAAAISASAVGWLAASAASLGQSPA